MPSYFFAATALVSLFASSLSQTIDPNSVSLDTRKRWCDSQTSQCPLICVQTQGNTLTADPNTCDPTTLDYSCVCSNGVSPNLTEYSLTIPYFICTQYNLNCQTACGNDNLCAAACVQSHPCGAQSPIRVNTSTISTTVSSSASVTGAAKTTASDGVVYTGFGGSTASATASSSTSHSGATRMLSAGEAYGMGVVVAGIFAGFALII